MAFSLVYKTVTPLLLSVLKTLMKAEEFREFRLVGGTGLSLYRGHRESVDIDLFTDAVYGSINFDRIINVFENPKQLSGKKTSFQEGLAQPAPAA